MEVSNRSSDTFENEGKRAYRARHLEVLRDQAPELWTDAPPGQLRGAWLELMGSTGWRTLELLTAAAVLPPSSFVGADLDHDRIDDYRRRYPGARWLAGDVLDYVEGPELDDISVVHFDGYEAAVKVGNFEPIRSVLGKLDAFATLDLSAGVDWGNSRAELFIENVFDERAELYRFTACNVLICGGNPYNATNRPMTIGVKFGQSF